MFWTFRYSYNKVVHVRDVTSLRYWIPQHTHRDIHGQAGRQAGRQEGRQEGREGGKQGGRQGGM